MRPGHVGSRIDPSLPTGRRRLAEALVHVYRQLDMTLREAADLLASHGYKKDPSEISRYLNGVHVPEPGFVQRLYDIAAERAGQSAMKLTRPELMRIRDAAEPTRCRTCPTLGRENHALRQSLDELKRNNAILQGSIDALQRASDRQEAENRRLQGQLDDAEAGLAATSATAQDRQALLPVPHQGGDRQQSAYEVLPARQLVGQVEELNGQGREPELLDLLRETAQVLTPLESAAALALLRHEKHHQLAETLTGIYGRDQPERHVISTALALFNFGMPDDAGALLRAATTGGRHASA